MEPLNQKIEKKQWAKPELKNLNILKTNGGSPGPSTDGVTTTRIS